MAFWNKKKSSDDKVDSDGGPNLDNIDNKPDANDGGNDTGDNGSDDGGSDDNDMDFD